MLVYQSLDEQLEPVINEIVEELESSSPAEYSEVLDRWMELIRETIAAATVEYNTDYKTE